MVLRYFTVVSSIILLLLILREQSKHLAKAVSFNYKSCLEVSRSLKTKMVSDVV